ncbi:MAG: hypothetical protein ACKOCW_14325 [Planctomycetaceae bacterium]
MNHHTGREIAKFLAGIAFGESVGHIWLGTLGTHLLPLSLTTFTFTATMNTVCMVAWPIVCAALVWYGWLAQANARRSVTA